MRPLPPTTFRIENAFPALQELREHYPHFFSDEASAAPLVFREKAGDATSVTVTASDTGIEIAYTSIPAALKGLTHLFALAAEGKPVTTWSDSSPFSTRGVMLDASRNAVPTLNTVKRFIRQMALMGLNELQLYCEDVYEIDGEPFFGYFRGRYSQAELKAIDAYAAQFGIEVILCIQTLGHLEQMLQWPKYRALRDTSHVLLAEDDASYEMIGKMLDAAASSLSSRRIHIGMDEAHGIGSGAHRLKKGLKPPFEIISAHLEKVSTLCEARGLKPMIWSDMFFRLGTKSNDYYDVEGIISPLAARRIPQNTELVYWDYYHRDPAFYEEWIWRHRLMGQTPIFATGLWTWGRFWTALPYAMEVVRAGLDAVRKQGIKKVFATLWCDDGAEIDILSALPALHDFAEQCYSNHESEARRCFEAIAGSQWDEWITACEIDSAPGTPISAGNLSKWLLWHDPLLGFLNDGISPTLPEHYASVAKRLEKSDDPRLQFPLKIAKALALKSAIHRDLRDAALSNNTERLTTMATKEIPALIAAVETLHEHHRLLWRQLYKPFGWEVIDIRYGGLLARLKTLRQAVESAIEDLPSLTELLLEPLPIQLEESPIEGIHLSWARSITASATP